MREQYKRIIQENLQITSNKNEYLASVKQYMESKINTFKTKVLEDITRLVAKNNISDNLSKTEILCQEDMTSRPQIVIKMYFENNKEYKMSNNYMELNKNLRDSLIHDSNLIPTDYTYSTQVSEITPQHIVLQFAVR